MTRGSISSPESRATIQSHESESKQHADGRAIEVEVADLQADDVGAGLLEIPEVAIVDTQADVIGEVAHHADADVPPEVVLREVADAVHRRDVLTDPADADRAVRPDAAA